MRYFKPLIISCFSFVILPFLFNADPIAIYHNNTWYFPVYKDYFESDYGGDLHVLIDYQSTYGQNLLKNSYTISAPYKHGLKPDYTMPHNLANPSKKYFLGTNSFGQDIVAYIIHAIVFHIFIAVSLTYISAIIGASIGCFIALSSRNVDICGQWVKEVCKSIPLILVITITQTMPIPYFFILFILTQWTRYATYARTQTYQLLAQPFIQDAQQQGFSQWWIMKQYIRVPVIKRIQNQLMHSFIGYFTLLQSLAYFGLNIFPDHPSLGVLIQQAQQHPNAIMLLMVCAAGFVMVGILAFVFLGPVKTT